MRIVRTGTWVYDDASRQKVDVVALDYDFWFAIGEADDALEPGEQAMPLGPDGCLYYVRFQHAGDRTTPTWVDSGGCESLEEAMAFAEGRTSSAIEWKR
jgi:hypothetical protein